MTSCSFFLKKRLYEGNWVKCHYWCIVKEMDANYFKNLQGTYILEIVSQSWVFPKIKNKFCLFSFASVLCHYGVASFYLQSYDIIMRNDGVSLSFMWALPILINIIVYLYIKNSLVLCALPLTCCFMYLMLVYKLFPYVHWFISSAACDAWRVSFSSHKICKYNWRKCCMVF